MDREPFDKQGRVNRSFDAKYSYLTGLDVEAGLFDEKDVVYYWDWMAGSAGRKEINFLCAEWEDFISQCNPSAFVRSWGADCAGWPGESGFNSAGLFGQFLADSRFSITDRFEVLCEMARVKENTWAREMIEGLVRNHRITDCDTGDALEVSFLTQHEITEIKDKVLEYLSEKDGNA
ncbi:hypothetical protein [Sphingosinithalassobacter sp. CS137]|uniref:hypothetical protein n=1 Tax=Sphingosinithalassobacter sp. CS137 TaxID=2762748 RepID=UPI00165E5C04|nr:hypothetical protein [Sphingosinithalassobacter sp. CS137]